MVFLGTKSGLTRYYTLVENVTDRSVLATKLVKDTTELTLVLSISYCTLVFSS